MLGNFSLSIHENQIIGIVGESGCGKSTLLKLLMRFWAVKKGRIGIVDDPGTEASGRIAVDINEVNTSNLRDMESYMTQDTQMFKDTITNNIRIAKLDATQEEVEEACRKASLHDWIMTLPNGYETNVGELGDGPKEDMSASASDWPERFCMTRPSCSSTSPPATWTASMRRSS